MFVSNFWDMCSAYVILLLMSRSLIRFVALAEFGYLMYLIFLSDWSLTRIVFNTYLSLLAFLPCGIFGIWLTKSSIKWKATFKFFFIYGMFLFVFAWILLFFLGMAKDIDRMPSLDSIFAGATSYLLVAGGRYTLQFILEKISGEKRYPAEIFSIGILKTLFLFTIIWPASFMMILFTSASWIKPVMAIFVLAAVYTFDIKQFGRFRSAAEFHAYAKQVGLDER